MDGLADVFHNATISSAVQWLAIATRASSPTARLPLVRELDHPYLWMLLRGKSGLAALLSGDTDAAREAFREQARTLPRARRPARRF